MSLKAARTYLVKANVGEKDLTKDQDRAKAAWRQIDTGLRKWETLADIHGQPRVLNRLVSEFFKALSEMEAMELIVWNR